MGSTTARLLIPHLLFPSSSSSSSSSSSHNPSTNPHTKSSKPLSFPNHNSLPTRRLLLFSLPIATAFLLPIPNSPIQPSSSFAVESFDPVSRSEKEASAAISRRVSEAVELLDKGRELQALGDFNQALLYFTQVIDKYKDFAFSDYARVGRALALYEIGDREEAIAEMEDVSISLKGYPEVHAALAAALYVDKHAALLAENQFTIATLLDPHYVDISLFNAPLWKEDTLNMMAASFIPLDIRKVPSEVPASNCNYYRKMLGIQNSDVLSFKLNAIADRQAGKCFQQIEWAIKHVLCPCLSKSYAFNSDAPIGHGRLIHTSQWL